MLFQTTENNFTYTICLQNLEIGMARDNFNLYFRSTIHSIMVSLVHIFQIIELRRSHELSIIDSLVINV